MRTSRISPPAGMELPPPGLAEQIQQRRNRDAARRIDLRRWAATWMDDLVNGPRSSDQWMEWCQFFLDEMFCSGGNDGLQRLLYQGYPHHALRSILRDLCEGAWRQAAPRRQALLRHLTALPPMERNDLEMQHWRQLAELRAMMRRLLGERALDPRPVPRRPDAGDDQAMGRKGEQAELQDGRESPVAGEVRGGGAQ